MEAKRYQITIPMPCASRMYFNPCAKIDHHNRICEMVGVNKCVGTHSWSMRMNLSILSMMFTDACFCLRDVGATIVTWARMISLSSWPMSSLPARWTKVRKLVLSLQQWIRSWTHLQRVPIQTEVRNQSRYAAQVYCLQEAYHDHLLMLLCQTTEWWGLHLQHQKTTMCWTEHLHTTHSV